jgi:hypothetical protein
MSQPGIFRLAGDGTRISHLTKVFNLSPLYGDTLSITSEPIHNLTGLVKRYVRDLPEPILDESLFPAFLFFCAEPEPGALVLPLSTRVTAAQILLKLLPPLHFSLFIYLLAFLGQLPLFPDNRLNTESISIIFGPAMCAARGKGISGLGPSTAGQRGVEHDPEAVSNLVNQSQATLAWLLKHWSAISEKVLDPTVDLETGTEEDKKGLATAAEIDPKLLSPIDLRQAQAPTELAYALDSSRPRVSLDSATRSITASSSASKSSPVERAASTHSSTSETSSRSTSSDHAEPGTPGTPGLFSRALSSMSSSMSISNDGGRGLDKGEGEEKVKVPKRSASFTSLSGLMKKGQGVLMGKSEKSVAMSGACDCAPREFYC